MEHIQSFYTLQLREDGFLGQTWVTLNTISHVWILGHISSH